MTASKLDRTLEPEVMDTLDDARDYDAMDHRDVNRVFVDDLLAAAGPGWAPEPQRGDALPEVLDLGAGTAQIPVELCRRAPGVRVLAIDLATHMLDLGQQRVEAMGLRDRILLQQADAKELPYESGRFAAVISNSIVHHIPQPATALFEAVRVCSPGGLLFFRDLLRPDDEATLQSLVAAYAAGCNDHQRSLFAASLHAALTLEEVRDLIAALGFPADTVQRTSDRHWTWSAVVDR